MRDIFTLTLIQLTARRRFAAMLLLAAVPVAIALLFAVLGSTFNPRRFADILLVQLVAAIVLPLVALVLAVATFGDEVEDRTLGYLLLKPIARWRVVLPKLAATAGVSVVVVGLAGFATVLLVTGDLLPSLAAAGGLGVGAAVYSAIFTWAGLMFRHALAFGLVYVFLWEASLSRLFEGIRFLSVRQYTLSAMHGLEANLLSETRIALGLPAVLLAAAVAVAVAGWLTDRKLRNMDVP